MHKLQTPKIKVSTEIPGKPVSLLRQVAMERFYMSHRKKLKAVFKMALNIFVHQVAYEEYEGHLVPRDLRKSVQEVTNSISNNS